MEQAWRAERIFEGMLAECFARVPKGVVVPPFDWEWLLGSGEYREAVFSLADLISWALSYPAPGAAELTELDRQSVWRDMTLAPTAISLGEESWTAGVDCSLILKAVATLSAKTGYAGLTAPRIRAAAGVSRRKFNRYFDGGEDCYLTALDLKATEALAHAARAQAAALSPADAVYRAIAGALQVRRGDTELSRLGARCWSVRRGRGQSKCEQSGKFLTPTFPPSVATFPQWRTQMNFGSF